MRQWWRVLGVPRGSDRATIRRAYAAKLKVTNPEDDAAGFMELRAAYEEALRWVDYQHFDDWDDAEQEEAAGERAGLTLVPVGEPLAPDHAALPETEPLPPPEPDPLEVERAADAAEFERRFAELESGLRGPWFKDREGVRAAFDAVMAAPALIELDRRAYAEYRLAALIADTIPRSDAILREAMAAFGWEGEGNHPPAIWALRARLDEWRLIASFGRGHALERGWRALIDGKSPGWLRRIRALRPGTAGQVRQLFELADYDVPGISHSFHPKAAEWWHAHLDAPRFGSVEMALFLLGGVVATLFAVLGASPAVRLWGAVGSVAGGVVLSLAHWRFVTPMRWRAAREGTVRSRGAGWRLGLWLVLTAAAIAAPATPWIAGGLAAAFLILAIAIFVLDSAEEIGGLAWQRMVMLAIAGAFIGPAFFAMTVGEQALTIIFGLSAGIVGLSARDAIARVIAPRPVLIALGIMTALIVGAIVRSNWLPGTPLIAWGAAAGTSLVLMSGLRAGDPDGRGSGVAALANMLLWAIVIIAAILSVPERQKGGPLPPPISVVPADPMKALEASEPGFRALKTGNPQVYDAVAAIRKEMAAGTRNADEGYRAIDALVNKAYQTRLPLVGSALIAAEMDIRLARARELRKADVRACAGDRDISAGSLSRDFRRRHYAHALKVAGAPLLVLRDLSKGREVPLMELLRTATNGNDAAANKLADALEGKDAAAKCDARIVMLEALVALPDIDIARTMRTALTSRARAEAEKK
ncbi:J domain-containing protein [Sphingomonas sp.]|uniref:J domain-containing protein n=1 Tax=Sphingomonas sp. TaxID=28214 RepID=UPI0018023A72|nr:J domain-containing protein [Sphingomonas sp.]MBA4760359.1 J domain-containing protein [Sphingomonas sp.]